MKPLKKQQKKQYQNKIEKSINSTLLFNCKLKLNFEYIKRFIKNLKIRKYAK